MVPISPKGNMERHSMKIAVQARVATIFQWAKGVFEWV
jgi:hypothetical protein